MSLWMTEVAHIDGNALIWIPASLHTRNQRLTLQVSCSLVMALTIGVQRRIETLDRGYPPSFLRLKASGSGEATTAPVIAVFLATEVAWYLKSGLDEWMDAEHPTHHAFRKNSMLFPFQHQAIMEPRAVPC
jgi:hypothetical protein